jgi:biopolymer transport protein ExbD
MGVVIVILCGFLALTSTHVDRIDVQLPASTPEAVAAYSAWVRQRIAATGAWCSEDYVLRVAADGKADFNFQPIPKGELGATLHAIFEQVGRPRRVLYVQPAANMRYGDVVKVVDLAKAAGVDQVVMLSATEWSAGR